MHQLVTPELVLHNKSSHSALLAVLPPTSRGVETGAIEVIGGVYLHPLHVTQEFVDTVQVALQGGEVDGVHPTAIASETQTPHMVTVDNS